MSIFKDRIYYTGEDGDRIIDDTNGWHMDDGSGLASRYSYVVETTEAFHVSRSDSKPWTVENLTMFNLFFVARCGRKKGESIFRELALHPLTGVQLDYLYLEG